MFTSYLLHIADFLHNSHVKKFSTWQSVMWSICPHENLLCRPISPHDRFFSTATARGACDKHGVISESILHTGSLSFFPKCFWKLHWKSSSFDMSTSLFPFARYRQQTKNMHFCVFCRTFCAFFRFFLLKISKGTKYLFAFENYVFLTVLRFCCSKIW